MLILCFNNIGQLQLYFYFNNFHPFPVFLKCFCHSDSAFFSGVLVYNLKRAAKLVLRFPNRTFVCTHPAGHQNGSFTVPLNLTKLNSCLYWPHTTVADTVSTYWLVNAACCQERVTVSVVYGNLFYQ